MKMIFLLVCDIFPGDIKSECTVIWSLTMIPNQWFVIRLSIQKIHSMSSITCNMFSRFCIFRTFFSSSEIFERYRRDLWLIFRSEKKHTHSKMLLYSWSRADTRKSSNRLVGIECFDRLKKETLFAERFTQRRVIDLDTSLQFFVSRYCISAMLVWHVVARMSCCQCPRLIENLNAKRATLNPQSWTSSKSRYVSGLASEQTEKESRFWDATKSKEQTNN